MSRIKAKRVGFRIDMTPMVDVAFLLLTFFMLTTKFRPPEIAEVDLPSSHSQLKLPESDVLTVTVSGDNTFFMGVSSRQAKEKIFNTAVKPKLQAAKISEAEIRDSLKSFRLAESFPVGKDELDKFVLMARFANPKLRPVIRADDDAGFDAVNHAIKVYKKANMLTFNLVTVLEREVR
ncbi:ExbD/TolR family protein [Chlorobium phaeobacteroides]|uniref:Outer membrane transport energization protein ExbD n=1 Tax=Chlorobium phaeobacteroides (strain DSM 266 / SMG 266 / 2430) TaxID=290317 RepID=A1BE33_CHLPD|nr:biopolymer transporter ExbD [Chlorobium phaeobacteroides]ABL64660.1 outer membrane transport energization protein ExbD [Chlorobium phaeobacteroides DSM 266]MBV5326284.1 biopolymer transporter ExbD [Chlorobium sp.]